MGVVKNIKNATILINMKKILITGTSRGIGLATAKKFLAEGWLVYGASTSVNKNLQHQNYRHFILDLSDQISIKTCVNKIKNENPQIDVLIDCAGVSFEPDGDEFNLSSLRKNLEVNLIGTIDLTEQIIPILSPNGHIVLISSKMSSLDDFTGRDYPAYRISKTALNMYVKTLADRLKTITVSAFDPGWVKTDMGGPNAPREPEIPAGELYSLVTSAHPSGNFWYEGKTRSW